MPIFFLRSGNSGMPGFMRKLLTGYASSEYQHQPLHACWNGIK